MCFVSNAKCKCKVQSAMCFVLCFRSNVQCFMCLVKCYVWDLTRWARPGEYIYIYIYIYIFYTLRAQTPSGARTPPKGAPKGVWGRHWAPSRGSWGKRARPKVLKPLFLLVQMRIPKRGDTAPGRLQGDSRETPGRLRVGSK